MNLRTQIRWLIPFQSLAQTEDNLGTLTGTPDILWNLSQVPTWQRELEACAGLLLTSGSWVMPSLVCSESRLLRAEVGVLCHVP